MALTGVWAKVLFIAVSTIAVSYGWGMRGTTLGGEKGAMLPGALMGLLIAVFSGSDFLLQHFYLLSAIGALGIYPGGSMSYMQSAGLTSDRNPPDDYRRGMTGLFVKGSIWFGIFGAVVGMFLSFLTSYYYDLKAVALLFGLLPLFGLCGSRLFDRPFDEKKGIHPRIYFSRTRPEGVGVMFGLLVGLVAFMVIYRDTLALLLTAGSLISGGVGFVLGVMLQMRAKYPNKKGWQFLGKYHKMGWIGTWKVAECSYGAIAGLGISLTFVLITTFLPKYQAQYAAISATPQLTNLKPWILPAILVALLAADLLKYVIKRPRTAEELRYMNLRGWMSGDELEIALKTAGPEPSKAFLLYEKISHIAEFPIYCYIPLLFLFLGSGETAQLVSFYILWFVLVEQQALDRFNHFKYIYLWRTLLLGAGFLVIALQFLGIWTPDIFSTTLLYCLGYEGLTLVGNIAKNSPDRYKKKTVKESSLREAYGSMVTMHAYYFLCFAVVIPFMGWVAFAL